ncbi:MAG TPA: DUF4168 domain-containing protein, partial [Steroidobacteraceae bacterium]|nr:DUF4168 domain-containing protein [Steroidobacteraceae bacterium]
VDLMKISGCTASLVAMALMISGFVHAQSESGVPADQVEPTAPATEPGASSPATVEFDEITLDRFADAFVAVNSAHQEYSQKIAAESDPATVEDLKTQAHARMLQSVRDQGLEIDEFNRIALALQNDAALQQRIAERLEDRAGG